jgi:multidrug efflux pump subunit AcrB
LGLGSRLRREFFPEVDAGAFEMYVRARPGTRIEETEVQIAAVENVVKKNVGDDVELIISEIGVVADWSAAYTPNSGPMDAVVKVQMKENRRHSAQEAVQTLRDAFADIKYRHTAIFADPKHPRVDISDVEFSFDAGGMIRGAMNEGKSTPLNVRITSKDLEKAHDVAEKIEAEVRKVNGVVDCRIIQRLDYPEYIVDVDRAKAADLGLTQMEVMENLVAALNSSIQFNKKNFWIDPVTHNQYYVGVAYPEEDITDLETLLDAPINSPSQKKSIPLRNMASVRPAKVPSEITHTTLQPTIDLTMGVHGRDLGHVADDVYKVLAAFGQPVKDKMFWGLWTPARRGVWTPFDPASADKAPMPGSRITLSGEYSRMNDTFINLGTGLILAALLIYFLMVALFKSWLTPLVILSAVPIGLVGVIAILFLTGTAINVQSLLGVIFMVGIVVSNTVLLTDFAQHIRRTDGLSPTEAIVHAASVRVRPVVMTALAAFFALLPMALGLARGSEANTPLGRSVIGGLLAGLVTTLFVVPALYSLVLPDKLPPAHEKDVEEEVKARAAARKARSRTKENGASENGESTKGFTGPEGEGTIIPAPTS